MDGITGKGGGYYYRDNSRRAPHNLYTTGKDLAAAIKNYGYTSSLPENYTPHYQFATEETQNMLENGEDAAVDRYDDTHFTAKIEVNPSGTFYGWIFKFKGKIKILSPKECITEMQQIAQEFI